MPNSTIVLPARRIITMDPDRPEATAVAVSGGRITDVGAFEDLRDTGAIDDTFADAVLCLDNGVLTVWTDITRTAQREAHGDASRG